MMVAGNPDAIMLSIFVILNKAERNSSDLINSFCFFASELLKKSKVAHQLVLIVKIIFNKVFNCLMKLAINCSVFKDKFFTIEEFSFRLNLELRNIFSSSDELKVAQPDLTNS